MKDWVTLITAIIQLITALLLIKPKRANKKGTKRSRRAKRK